jgi:hypothetical protein
VESSGCVLWAIVVRPSEETKYLSVFPFSLFWRSFILHVLTDTHQLEWKLHMIIYQEFIDSFGLGGLE